MNTSISATKDCHTVPLAPSATCLYFGTFNPIHTGHLMVAQAALSQFSQALGIHSITFIPAGDPPHRRHENDLLDARQRFALVQLATAPNPAFRVSDVELLKVGKSYTVETIQALITQGVVTAPVPMIIGSDALAHLATWHQPEEMARLVYFLQAPRPDYPFVETLALPGKKIPLKTSPIQMPPLSLSSTWVRGQVQEALRYQGALPLDSLRYFLPDAVRDYILANRLYAD